MSAVEQVRTEFTRNFGHEPDGVWSAPGRVNLMGDHTDYNDGYVLPVALDLACLAAARRRDDGVLRMRSAQLGEVAEVRLGDLRVGAVTGWAAYPAGVAWALAEAGV